MGKENYIGHVVRDEKGRRGFCYARGHFQWDNSTFEMDGPSIRTKDDPQDVAAWRSHLSDYLIRFTNTISADPEVFLVDENSRALVPAFEVLPPKTPESSFFWDGFQAEWRPAPKNCLQQLGDEIFLKLQHLYNHARRTRAVAPTIQNTFRIPLAVRQNTAPDYINLGCEPSFNVYGVPSPIEGKDPTTIPWRSAGGHIHFGFPREFARFIQSDIELVRRIVKALDATIGVIGVSMAEHLDNPNRRRYYGRAGEYRLPKHGLEYRVLSNFWLAHPAIFQLIFEMARAAANAAIYQLIPGWTGDEKEIQYIINTCDVVQARVFIGENLKIYKMILDQMRAFTTGNHVQLVSQALSAFKKAVEEMVEDPNNIVKNWRLAVPVNYYPEFQDSDVYNPLAWIMNSQSTMWHSVVGKYARGKKF